MGGSRTWFAKSQPRLFSIKLFATIDTTKWQGYQMIPNTALQNYHPKPSGTTVCWQPNRSPVLGLTLDCKNMDWSQAEQGEAKTLHLSVTNLRWPAFTQHQKHKVGSCLEDLEVRVLQVPAVPDQNWLHHCTDTAHNQNPEKKGLTYKCHELNTLALLVSSICVRVHVHPQSCL